jgi:deazaflavin-dependent oxidoreductase (nitroreductase family)
MTGGRTFFRLQSRINIWLYRKTNGRVGSQIGAAPICLFTTTGRKSGMARTVPLIYLADGERVIVVASKRGTPHNPEWYLNLVASPQVTVEIEGDARAMLARTADATERDTLWPRLVAIYKGFEKYQKKTERQIPVVICTLGS